ncbi:MAG TPA: pyruvate kinase [Anaerolineaceae bacterium]|nr:pyruvate kinase [Anaerolineaceae bacterium]
MDRKAKIVATLGPSTNNEDILRQLIIEGVDIVRLNFSHGTQDDHLRSIELVRKLSEELHKPITILQDLQGPKLRVGILPELGIFLEKQQIVALKPIEKEHHNQVENNFMILPLDVPNLARSVKPGDKILLDDGNLELEAISVDSDTVYAKVIIGGKLTSNKGVNLPGTDLKIPGFTEKDKEDLKFGLDNGIDAVAISFVSGPEDVLKVKETIRAFSPHRIPPPVIAKLERPKAIEKLEEILDVTDGVMVARGDLAVETSPACVPIFQKRIIHSAYRKAKFVITATQMLDSMIHNPRPTRAEASDVANAILDGSDAVMLSGETAIGNYPVEVISMMDSIIKEAEANYENWGYIQKDKLGQTGDDAVALTRAAGELAFDRDVAYIAVLTQSGRTALLMSKVRPKVPILAFTPEEETYKMLNLFWGVKPYRVPYATTIEDMVAFVEEAIIATNPIKNGQQIIFVSGLPIGDMRPPNFLLLNTIGKK